MAAGMIWPGGLGCQQLGPCCYACGGCHNFVCSCFTLGGITSHPAALLCGLGEDDSQKPSCNKPGLDHNIHIPKLAKELGMLLLSANSVFEPTSDSSHW